MRGRSARARSDFFETAKLTVIVGNDDADAAPEFEIELVGTDLGLSAANFIF